MNEKQLLTLLRKKKGFFEAILELTESETDLPLNEWVPVLEQKRVFLMCIDEVDGQLHPFKKTLHTISEEIKAELDHMRHTVKKILLIDGLNQEKRKEIIKS